MFLWLAPFIWPCLLTETQRIIVNQDLCNAGMQLLSQKAELVLNSTSNPIIAIPTACKLM